MKKVLIIVALALLGCLALVVWLGSRSNQPNDLIAESLSGTSRGPAFDVRVIVPRLARPFAGILPDWVVRKMDATPGELRFDHTSRGAQIVSAGQNRVELKADDWHLLVETDTEGRITPATRFVFPLALGGRHLRLSCGPADPAGGSLRTVPRAGSDEIAGSFEVELAKCKNAESGRNSSWPPSALTLRGSFVGPVNDRR